MPTVTPLTFDIPSDLLDKVHAFRRRIKENTGNTLSEVVRYAIDRYDYARYAPDIVPHKQISVRISGDTKERLTRIAKEKQVSFGELLRVALSELPDSPPKDYKPVKLHPKPATAEGEKKSGIKMRMVSNYKKRHTS